MKTNDEKIDIQETATIIEMLKMLPRDTRRNFYFAIKGACMVAESQDTDKQPA